MIDLKRPARAVVEALSQRHVHISSRWKALPNTVRISIGTDQEMAAFRRAFAEVMGLNTGADAFPV